MNTAVAENPRAVIGGNNPPEPTPYELSNTAIGDLYEEAKLWLDGEPVETQEQADAINTLKTKIREAKASAEAAREEEIKPHQATVKEIQGRYNVLIGENKSITGLAIKAEQACNAALKPYLLKLAAIQEAAAKAARDEAERKQQEALAAMRERDAANLAQREQAEALVKEAKQAEDAARRAENVKAHAKGEGRATGLRTVYRAVVEDAREAAAWVWKERNDELMAFVQDQADKAVRAGAKSIRGFKIIEEKVL